MIAPVRLALVLEAQCRYCAFPGVPMDEFNAERAAWAITIAYALSLLLIGLVASRSQRDGQTAGQIGRERLFWLLAGLAIMALGLNKQLDLQTQLTAFGRQLARDGDWFDMRRQVQTAFVIGLAAVGAMIALWLAWMVRAMGGPVKLALAGLWMLGGFVLLRAASFHHLDQLLRTSLFGTRAWVVIELAGIAMVAAGAIWALRTCRKPA